MQDRYVGDANDFSKYLILRHVHSSLQQSLDKEPRIGVCWYLVDPNLVDADNPQKDGERISYLQDGKTWRSEADRELYETLRQLLIKDGDVRHEARAVGVVENGSVFPEGTVFYSEKVPQDREARETWYREATNALNDADIVFLDPDNSMSERSRHRVRGGKWAAVEEILGFANDQTSVAWVSHPRQRSRLKHHQQEIAKLKNFAGEFCSIYQGHIGLHFLLPKTHDKVRSALQELVKTGMQSSWGKWSYADSTGVLLNLDGVSEQDDTDAPEDRSDDMHLGEDHDSWQFQDAVILNDGGNLWKRRNPWLPVSSKIEMLFLTIEDQRLVRVMYEPFKGDSNQHGLKPEDWAENKANWRKLAEGTSNDNLRVLPAVFRVIEL